jgi:hypothetical protein
MTILFIQGPSNSLIKLLESNIMLFGNMAQDRMDGFALVVLLFAFRYFFGGDTTFGQINIT